MRDIERLETLCRWLVLADVLQISSEYHDSIPVQFRHFNLHAPEDEIVLELSARNIDGTEHHLFMREELLKGTFDEKGAFSATDWRGRKCSMSAMKLTPELFPSMSAWENVRSRPLVPDLDQDRIMAALKPFADIFATNVCDPIENDFMAEWYRKGDLALIIGDFNFASTLYNLRHTQLDDQIKNVAVDALKAFAKVAEHPTWNENAADEDVWWQHDGHILRVGDLRRARELVQETFGAEPEPETEAPKP